MTFEERLPQIMGFLAIRRSGWRLTVIGWDDVSQIIVTHFFEKYGTFDPTKGSKTLSEDKKFEHWANRVITNQLNNLLRNNLYKYSRPCIQGKGCQFNLGDSMCGYTKSGKQCAECPLYAEWKKRKGDQYNISASLPIENHSQEVSNMPHDFLDIKRAKSIIDDKIKSRLNENEWQMYELIWIKNLTPLEAGKKLKYKVGKNSKIPGYQAYMKLYHKVIRLSKQIIQEEHLA